MAFIRAIREGRNDHWALHAKTPLEDVFGDNSAMKMIPG
jgi:hypothetical protein